ncbi:MAG: hypothetical protein K2Q12_09605 [Rickettsiales bacterium]|nr:hypothetical protein [Rickettsiales bacterium]
MNERYCLSTAQENLAELVERALSGEEIIIGESDDALVMLRRHQIARERRVLGTLRGRIVIADDFDDASPALMQQMGLTP